MIGKSKRLLAAVLCLALMLVICPATVFASETDGPKSGDVVPGSVILTLKDQYLGNISELFPQLSIVNSEDLYYSVLSALPNGIPERMERYIGTAFCIQLSEETEEAVNEAVAVLLADPRVKDANPNYYGEYDVEHEITVADALSVLRVAAKMVDLTPVILRDYDKDQDGVITVSDALSVLRIAAKLA